MDVLSLTERVKNAIALSESHFREFKSALEGPPASKRPRKTRDIRKDVAEALVAFANADGGDLLIGVEDSGEITGLLHSDDEITEILNAPKDLVHDQIQLPLTSSTILDIEGKKILFFSVSKSSTEIFQLSDGRCVRRRDKETIPFAFKQIQFERQEVRSREFDRQFVDGASTNDLDTDLVQSLANQYLHGLSVERYLQQLGLAEYSQSGLRIRMAALLLFAKDVHRWHPRVQVRILRVHGTSILPGEHYNVVADDTTTSNVFQLLTEAWERLRPHLANKTEFGADARFEQRYLYPEGAAREALINAITHRDYSIQNAIEIFIFSDRMEIKSPGPLLSTISVESLRALEGAHESRNVLIAKVLRENKYVRELGEGMRRIFDLMEESSLEKPKLYSNTVSFSVTLVHRSVFTPLQQNWLDLFPLDALSARQQKIIAIGMNAVELSPQKIMQAMNTTDRNTYDREVTALRNAGFLVQTRTNPAAAQLARYQNRPKVEIGRFKVVSPGQYRKSQ